MKIGMLWFVVTVTTEHSTLGDICFPADVSEFADWARGATDGNRAASVVAYTTEKEAVVAAKKIMAGREAYESARRAVIDGK